MKYDRLVDRDSAQVDRVKRSESLKVCRTTMSPSQWKTVVWAITCATFIVQGVQGNGFVNFGCELLPAEDCAFAVGAGGFRCVLETSVHMDGSITYECQTLEIKVQLSFGSLYNSPGSMLYNSPGGYIETDACINACGLQRLTVGISTDEVLYNNSFKEKLCSRDCRDNCFNIIDHYSTIMAEEGEDLTRTCDELLAYIREERQREIQKALRERQEEISLQRQRRQGLPVGQLISRLTQGESNSDESLTGHPDPSSVSHHESERFQWSTFNTAIAPAPAPA